MPEYEVWSTKTIYERHVIDAEDERDAFWALMLDEPPYVRHSEVQDVYRIRRRD
jgi:hypothetical protein